MDAGFVDEEGFLYIMSRSDDVINVAGHRLSTGALEEVSLTTQIIITTTSIFVVAILTDHIWRASFSLSCCTLPWWTVPWWGWRTP